MNRELRIVDLTYETGSKTLRISFAGREHNIGFQSVEIYGLGNQWLVSREDMDSAFEKYFKSYYAALLAELASQKYTKGKLSIDLDELDQMVGIGRNFRDFIPRA